MTTTAIHWRSFFLHKDGNRPDEYEDAYAGNPKVGRFAVADGASESSFAALWAKLLVDGFVATREGRTTVGWLPPLQQKWSEAVDHLELEWFAEEKRQMGAFATFLGLSFKKPQDGRVGRWKALAVGDCCLFQLRDDALVAAFPATKSADFGNRPHLLCSRLVKNRDPLLEAVQKLGRWTRGDRFFLLSDALAQWFLQRHEEKLRPWQSLARRMPEPTALTKYVEKLRSQNELKNDDVTLLMIDL